jgi:hypothetical protein
MKNLTPRPPSRKGRGRRVRDASYPPFPLGKGAGGLGLFGWGTAFALLLVLALAVPTAAQSPVSARAAISQDSVTVGDRIRVTVTVTLPADAQADITALEQQFGDLELLFVGLPSEKPLTDGRKEVLLTYDVAAFRTGAAQLPPLTVQVRLASGEPASAATAALPITVNSVIPPGENPTDVRDLKPQVSLPAGGGIARRTVALIVAAVAVTLAAALLVVRWLRRPRVVMMPLPQAPPSPESIARAELDRIAALGLLERGDPKQFHALLAACIRRYLSDRYGFHAYAMTTTELRRSMGGYGVDRWQARLVTGLLTESDAVNFAQYVPARPRCEANLEMAYQIIDAGEPDVEAPPAPAAPAPAR